MNTLVVILVFSFLWVLTNRETEGGGNKLAQIRDNFLGFLGLGKQWLWLLAGVAVGTILLLGVSAAYGLYSPDRYIKQWEYGLVRIGNGDVSSWFDINANSTEYSNVYTRPVRFKIDTGDGIIDFNKPIRDVSVVIDPSTKPHVVRTSVMPFARPSRWLLELRVGTKYTLYAPDAKGNDIGLVRSIQVEP